MEIAEDLLSRGWACDITSWSFGQPMQTMARKAGMGVLRKPADVKPFAYDLVWLQNRLECVFDYAPSEREAHRTLFAFAHLDETWNLAQPGVVAEGLLGQLFIVTSERGADRVIARGLPAEAVRMFRNAAPAAFERVPPPAHDRPGTVFIVSNHAPPEVLAAGRMLREAGVAVEHWGQGGDVEGKRLLPADLARADAVITIGKTVPYALRARRPAYVYDHFGGPGWLREAHFDAVAERNFSGRCCGRRVDAATIAHEILAGYAAAAAEASARPEPLLRAFRLEDFVTDVIAMVTTAPTPDDHRARLKPHLVAFEAERSLAAAAGHYFAATMRARRQAAAEMTGAVASG